MMNERRLPTDEVTYIRTHRDAFYKSRAQHVQTHNWNAYGIMGTIHDKLETSLWLSDIPERILDLVTGVEEETVKKLIMEANVVYPHDWALRREFGYAEELHEALKQVDILQFIDLSIGIHKKYGKAVSYPFFRGFKTILKTDITPEEYSEFTEVVVQNFDERFAGQVLRYLPDFLKLGVSKEEFVALCSQLYAKAKERYPIGQWVEAVRTFGLHAPDALENGMSLATYAAHSLYAMDRLDGYTQKWVNRAIARIPDSNELDFGATQLTDTALYIFQSRGTQYKRVAGWYGWGMEKLLGIVPVILRCEDSELKFKAMEALDPSLFARTYLMVFDQCGSQAAIIYAKCVPTYITDHAGEIDPTQLALLTSLPEKLLQLREVVPPKHYSSIMWILRQTTQEGINEVHQFIDSIIETTSTLNEEELGNRVQYTLAAIRINKAERKRGRFSDPILQLLDPSRTKVAKEHIHEECGDENGDNENDINYFADDEVEELPPFLDDLPY